MASTAIARKIREALAKTNTESPPVDVEEIARNCGISIVRDQLEDDISGFIVRKKDQIYIGINSSHPANRQRFSIAHELGHYFLHLTQSNDFFVDRNAAYFRNQKSGQGTISQEIAANTFAAELLMPQRMIEQELSRHEGELDDIEIYKLSNQFRVSDQAMRYRLANLGVITNP